MASLSPMVCKKCGTIMKKVERFTKKPLHRYSGADDITKTSVSSPTTVTVTGTDATSASGYPASSSFYKQDAQDAVTKIVEYKCPKCRLLDQRDE
jgi:ssDNA-binding Zn-finger/Zn-ribbon topoisomerase 1